MNYVLRVLLGLDRFCNAILGGDPKETMSSRMGKFVARKRGWFPCQLCKLLNLIDPNHCVNNIDKTVGETK